MGYGINLATYGIPGYGVSHIGILGEYRNELVLFESTTLNDLPCVVQGKRVSGAQVQPLGPRLAHYSGKIWHNPLTRPLYRHESERLTTFLISQIGRPYDAIGAFRSGGGLFSLVESFLREENLCSLFCSEMCAAAHSYIGLFPTSQASRWNPNRLVRRERSLGIIHRPRRIVCD